MSIVRNIVATGARQDPDVTAGDGILFGHTRGGSAEIAHNTVICENPFASGILLVGGGASPGRADNSIIREEQDNDARLPLWGHQPVPTPPVPAISSVTTEFREVARWRWR